jgi:two-component system chemotaxis response regulator CheB
MPVRVLVVDDSALMRQIISRMLREDSELQVVGTAYDGQNALEKIERLRPDVITLDVAMPNMDGLECLRRIMDAHPLPVIMVSYLTLAGATHTIKALELGAVDFVTKNTTHDPAENLVMQNELIQKVKVAATIRISELRPVVTPFAPPAAFDDAPSPAKFNQLEVMVIGCSTGGPRALHQLIPNLPAGFPVGLIIAQHMPRDFTRVFAQRLNDLSQLEVREAQTGDLVQPGRVLIAPSGRQTTVRRDGEGRLTVAVSEAPNLLYKPSIDHLLHSVAVTCGHRVLGVILTGMGLDGAQGLRELRNLGARTIAEAEESCVVYGMPRAAAELGGVEFVESLPQVLPRVERILREYR